jgi:membrane-associated phospholipid phosphatase
MMMIRTKALLLLTVFLALASAAHARPDISTSLSPSPDHVFAGNMQSSASNSSIIQIHRASFLCRYGPWIVATLAGTALFAVDRDVHTFSQRSSLHSKDANHFFSPIEDFGRGGPYAIAVPLLVGHGLLFKKNKTLVAGGELIVGLLAEEAITQPIKAAFGRKRPYETNSPFRFFKGGTSFFSGHAITAFTFATIVSKNFPHQNLGFIGIHHAVPIIPILTYTTAGLVGIQRLFSNNHWSSDVYYGALMGYAVGSAVVHFGKKVHLRGFSMEPHKTPMLVASFAF